MPVDPHSHVPLYEQIVEHIRGLVAAGVCRPGEPLPSIRALALELVVNPNTVQRAYQELERQGLVYTRKGLGVFVAKNGEESAQNRSEAVVHSRFVQGIDIARAASISRDRVQAIFQEAMGSANDGARKPQDARKGSRRDAREES
jgi:GntR family transcriptional regulator